MAEEIIVNREYKDRMIRFLFKGKKELLSLYNAVNHTHYENEDDLEIYNIEDYLYMGMKNDISCLIDWSMNLFEHQSTWNSNMPLRGFFYAGQQLRKFVAMNHLDLYSSTLMTIPVPQYYVLYNGKDEISDRLILRLTDSMRGKDARDKSCVEFKAEVLNINEGHNQEIMDACPILKEYSMYISKLRQYLDKGIGLTDAVEQTTTYCIKNNILADILAAHRAEVTDMMMIEYDEALHIQKEKEISYNEGKKSQEKETEAAQKKAEAAKKENEELKKQIKEMERRLKALEESK